MSYTHPHPTDSSIGPRWPRPPDSILPPLVQVREAYLQFMMSVAMMLRADMNLPENSYLVREDMVQVLELETQLANVRPWPKCGGRDPGPRLPLTQYDHLPSPLCRPRPPRRRGTMSLPYIIGWA